MISRRWHLRTGRLLAVAYLLATTLGGLFHDHGVHEHAAHEHAAHEHEHAAHELDGFANAGNLGLAAAQAELSAADADHDADCVVCRFLGQKPAPVHVVTVAVLCHSVSLPPAPAPHCPVAPLQRTLHWRAPPVLA